MERLTKTISLDVEAGTISERIAHALTTTRRRGQAMNLIRDWITAGKLLDEMGTGIMPYLLAMEKASPNASQKERIQTLMGYLQRLDTSILSEQAEPQTTVVRQLQPGTVSPEPIIPVQIKAKRPPLAIDD